MLRERRKERRVDRYKTVGRMYTGTVSSIAFAKSSLIVQFGICLSAEAKVMFMFVWFCNFCFSSANMSL